LTGILALKTSEKKKDSQEIKMISGSLLLSKDEKKSGFFQQFTSY